MSAPDKEGASLPGCQIHTLPGYLDAFLHIKSGIFAINSSYSSFSIVGKKKLNLLTKINHMSFRSNFQIVNHFGCFRYIVFAMYLDNGCTAMCLENPKQLTI